MPTRDDWRELIREAANERPAPVAASTFLERLGTASQPVKVMADDGHVYLVKGRQNGRMIVNEQIVAALGTELHAPIPPVALVDVPEPLIRAEANMQHLQPGVSHGSRWLDSCSDRQGIAYTDRPENRPRFAALAILYSWVQGGDQQLIYEKTPPNLVYSVDHGHFFPGGPNWTVAGLQATGDPGLDATFQACGLDDSDYTPVIDRLRSLPSGAIATAVARPRQDWQISEDERVEVAVYLDDRRWKLIELLGQVGGTSHG